MKLVIDISETLKDIADKEDAKTFSHMMWQAILMDAVRNGTPLDDIRKEINDLPKTYPFINHIDTYVKTDDVIRIIDRHIGERSKDAT